MNTPAWVEAIAAVGTLLIAVLATAYAVREHRNAREAFIVEMQRAWSRLGPSWARLVMIQLGSHTPYAITTKDERNKIEPIAQTLSQDNYSDDWDDARLAVQSDVRAVIRFLSYAAEGVVGARWRVGEAYTILGPDVARHHRLIRVLSHREAHGTPFLQSTEFNTFDEQDLVYLFAVLIRAEQCRRGDTYGHFIVELADEMRGPLGEAVQRCARRISRTRHRLGLPLRVRLLLHRAEHPRIASVFMMPDNPIVGPDKYRLFRAPLEPLKITTARISRARRRAGHTSVRAG